LLDFPPSSFGEGRLLALRELDLALAESEDWVSAAAILVLLIFKGFIFSKAVHATSSFFQTKILGSVHVRYILNCELHIV
jgi:hypothetical protein